MRVLTLRRPWATLLITPGPSRKDVENRVRNIAGDYRGPVAVHSGLEIDRKARIPWADASIREEISAALPAGAIVGVVDLIDVHEAGDCDHLLIGGPRVCSAWALPGHFHLVTANPRPLAPPIPYRGALGLRVLPDDIAALVDATPTWTPDIEEVTAP